MDNEQAIIIVNNALDSFKWDDAIDQLLAPFTDVTDTLGNISGPVKAALSIWRFANRKRMEAFFKNFYKTLHEGNVITPEEKEKVIKFLKSPQNTQHFSDIINAVLFSKSLRCNVILGYYAGKYLKDKKELNYTDYIIVSALSNMNDRELNAFVKMYSICNYEKERNIPLNIVDWKQRTELEADMIKQDLYKFQSLQLGIFEKTMTAVYGSDEPLKADYVYGKMIERNEKELYFIFSSSASVLYDLVFLINQRGETQ